MNGLQRYQHLLSVLLLTTLIMSVLGKIDVGLVSAQGSTATQVVTLDSKQHEASARTDLSSVQIEMYSENTGRDGLGISVPPVYEPNPEVRHQVLATNLVLAEEDQVVLDELLALEDPAGDVRICDSVSEIPLAECQALLALYNNTGGGNLWINTTGWLTTTTPCSWYGITCVSGHVERVELIENGLRGKIPSKLGRLPALVILNLKGNTLQGSLPETLQYLKNLEYLNLGSNELEGSVPSWLGKLTYLYYLNLSNNLFSGSIPENLKYLVDIECLYLSSNHLSGSIPGWIGRYPYLHALNLSNNRFSGSIPEKLGNSTSLFNLNLGTNRLSGSIPASLGNLTNLTCLDLSNNQLSGVLPDSLTNLTKIVYLILEGNRLSGSIPAWIGNLADLDTLFLNNNQLSGSIPAEMAALTQLDYLDLSVNPFTSQTIPAWMGNLTQLSGLWLSDAGLTGSIPDELANLTDLFYLNLSMNTLSGEIPESLGNLVKLWGLWLQGNQLSGSIPEAIGNITDLFYLYLGENALSGVIPSSFGNLTKLTVLDLHSNQLSGSIPEELLKLKDLEYILLAVNSLSGSVPSWIGDIGTLYSLDLHANQFNGSIPDDLGDLSFLGYLDLSENKLSGSIPNELGDLTSLVFLDLSSNRLSGGIPMELGFLPKLAALSLDDNELSGGVPYELANLKNLILLSIRDNYGLDGSLPVDLMNLNLESFYFANTSVCEPENPAFQGWLNSISDLLDTGICDGVPGRPILLTPNSDANADSWTPTFNWNNTIDTEAYQLYIYKDVGTARTIIFKQWYPYETAVCDDDHICSITLDITLGAGPYLWRVRGMNSEGSGDWSTTQTFNTPAKPGQVTGIDPVNNIDNWLPTFHWYRESASQSYFLYIYQKSGTNVVEVHKEWYTTEDLGCTTENICSATPTVDLGGGTYFWRVRGKNPSGKGSWSETLSFMTPAKPGQVTSLTPSGESGSWTPTFNWNKEVSSNEYQLYIYQKNGTGTVVILKRWYTANETGCDNADLCTITPQIELGSGRYIWMVRGRNPSGKGVWSEALSFRTPDKPAQVVLTVPIGDTIEANPLYVWEEIDQAEHYQVAIIMKGGAVVIKDWLAASEVCVDGVCSTSSIGQNLAPGEYQWKVRAANPSGNGEWSELTAFSVAQ